MPSTTWSDGLRPLCCARRPGASVDTARRAAVVCRNVRRVTAAEASMAVKIHEVAVPGTVDGLEVTGDRAERVEASTMVDVGRGVRRDQGRGGNLEFPEIGARHRARPRDAQSIRAPREGSRR